MNIAREFNNLFPSIAAKVGGETGIDIFPIGNDKSQIVRDFDKEDIIYFFGDKMDNQGNDFPLKERLIKDNYNAYFHSVTCWQDTFDILKNV